MEDHGQSSEHAKLHVKIHGLILNPIKQEIKQSLMDITGLLEVIIKIQDQWFPTMLGLEEKNVVKQHQTQIHQDQIRIHLIVITIQLGMKLNFIKLATLLYTKADYIELLKETNVKIQN